MRKNKYERGYLGRSMNADISETGNLENGDLRFRFQGTGISDLDLRGYLGNYQR